MSLNPVEKDALSFSKVYDYEFLFYSILSGQSQLQGTLILSYFPLINQFDFGMLARLMTVRQLR